MPHPNYHLVNVYYFAYFTIGACIIILLARIFHRAGLVFLKDTFGANTTMIRAVAQLLDVGFYLMSIGYLGASFRTYQQMYFWSQVLEVALVKIGWFLLLMGLTHFFNLLLLALFRGRGTTSSPISAA